MRRTILGWAVTVNFAHKRSLWFYRLGGSEHVELQRADKIFSLERIYLRVSKVYVWSLVLGRMQILAASPWERRRYGR